MEALNFMFLVLISISAVVFASSALLNRSSGNAASTDCSKTCRNQVIKRGPVCGNDWKTYDSECLLKKQACEQKQALVVVYRGRCISGKHGQRGTQGDKNGCIKIKCNPTVRPVCGSDGQRYSNECQLRKRSCFSKTAITKVSTINAQHTRCYESLCPKCSSTYRVQRGLLVCGSNGVTYRSLCHLSQAACKQMKPITVLFIGHC